MWEWLKDALVAIFYLSAVIVFWLLTGENRFSILCVVVGLVCYFLLENYRDVLSTFAEFMYLGIMFMLIKRFIIPLIFET